MREINLLITCVKLAGVSKEHAKAALVIAKRVRKRVKKLKKLLDKKNKKS